MPGKDTSLKLSSDRPILSIIIPVYNHAAYLMQCFKSAITQTQALPFEIIIVDDASPDPAVYPLIERALDFAKGRKASANLSAITVLSNSINMGITRTQIRAATKASGQYIVFLDCDDYLPKDALKGLTSALTKSDADYIFTDRYDISKSGKRIGNTRYGGYPYIQPGGDIGLDLIDGMVASHLKVIKTQAVLEHSDPESLFIGIQDWELALNLLAQDAKFLYVPKPLYCHRLHDASVSASERLQQFYLSSVLRRRELERRYRRDKDKPLPLALDEQTLSEAKLPELKAHWENDRLLTFASTDLLDWTSLNFLMIYNAYFDAISLSDLRDQTRLFGYLWSPEIMSAQYAEKLL